MDGFSLPLNGTRCVISVPPAWPCYLDAWGADNSHARACKKYIRSMASLVGYLEKCLELARDGVSIRLEGDTAASDDEANASDDATPPSVAPSQATRRRSSRRARSCSISSRRRAARRGRS